MSKLYETVILFEPELPEDQRKEFVQKLSGVISSYQGEVRKHDDWGLRKLAYPIRKKSTAFYTFLLYTGDRGVVEELERNLKIFDSALRFLTTLANVKAQKAAPAQAPEAAPAAPAGEAPAGEAPPAAGEAPPAAGEAPPAPPAP